jgi:hypothetical protein
MSEDLEKEIKQIYKQKGGRLSANLKTEFVVLCQDDFHYRPDMTCGKCIYKHVVKLYNKYFK